MANLKDDIKNATKEQLILMLYDGCLLYTDEGKVALLTKEYERAHDKLVRAQNILLELLYALDRKSGGEVADNLAELYTYCYQRLVEADIHKEPAKCDECRGVILKLRDAWADALKRLKEAAGGA